MEEDRNLLEIGTSVGRLISVLFMNGDPVPKKGLVPIVGSREDLEIVLNQAREQLRPLGLVILADELTLQIAVAPEYTEVVSDWGQIEGAKPISNAAMETLSVLCYLGGGTKAEIDFVRGVNSYFTLRKLSVRGFVDLVGDRYEPTIEALGNLSVDKIQDLPDWSEVNQQLRQQLNAQGIDMVE